MALLRVLECGEVTRVGENKPRKVKVRVLSACNEPLDKLVADGKFRRDLWQRLREMEIRLPPLRERSQEIPALVHHFCATMDGGPYTITPETVDILASYSWKDGNIRELRNCLRAMTALQVNKSLSIPSIPQRIWEEFSRVHEGERRERDRRSEDGNPITSTTLKSITLALPSLISPDTPISFEGLVDNVFVQLVTQIFGSHNDPISLRALARSLELSPSVTQSKLHNLVEQGMFKQDVITRICL